MSLRLASVVLFSLLALSDLRAAEPKSFRVKHEPEHPRAGKPVRITAVPKEPPGQRKFVLQYQVVEPGHYIEKSDPAYKRSWTSLPLEPDNAGAFVAEIPPTVQKHRRLIRYRIMDGDRMVAPSADDAQLNFAFFVYNGVPDWRAAINPAGDSASRKTELFPGALLSSVQVYQFIAKQSAVERTTWYEPSDIFNPRTRHEYKYTGTLVVDGVVYDHVRFRARGGEWRYAMGKNMWKFDFNRGHHLQARDNFGRRYRTKWEKLNLGACIQQGNYDCRGEHGLFEAVTYKLFNLAGVPAPNTHFVHLRIIDEAEENPASQYKGDFWGLYLATEEIDGNFLEDHQLADGNIYKWDFGQPKPEHFAASVPTNRQDVLQFVNEYRRQQPDQWWRDHIDLERYFSYRSILECVHHYDVGAGKNYFYYFHTPARRWVVLPWDVDLTWKNTMYGTGQEPFWRAGVLRRPAFSIEYQNRLREIRDLLFNTEQTGALIDEFAAVIASPQSGLSFVDADRAKWDFHPIMDSRWVDARKAGQGQYYAGSATHDFAGMLRMMKEFVLSRGRWCDASLLSDPNTPPTPKVELIAPPESKSPIRAKATLATKLPNVKTQWRLAEISTAPAVKSNTPRPYEIEPVWEEIGGADAAIPARELKSGHEYRVRARSCDESGRCSHWSAPVEFKAK